MTRPPTCLLLAPLALHVAYWRPDWIGAVIGWPVQIVLTLLVQRGMP